MSELVRDLVSEMARRNRWDGEAIYAIISLETGRTFEPHAGVERWAPKATASGLLQWTEGTARALGVPTNPSPPHPSLQKFRGEWATWELLAMTVEDQVLLAEKFYSRAFVRKAPKGPVDYYLAGWGAAPGLSDTNVLALKGESKYELNRVLDRNRDGKIEVRDLRLLVEGRMLEIAKASVPPPAPPPPISPLSKFEIFCSLGFAMLRARL